MSSGRMPEGKIFLSAGSSTIRDHGEEMRVFSFLERFHDGSGKRTRGEFFRGPIRFPSLTVSRFADCESDCNGISLSDVFLSIVHLANEWAIVMQISIRLARRWSNGSGGYRKKEKRAKIYREKSRDLNRDEALFLEIIPFR